MTVTNIFDATATPQSTESQLTWQPSPTSPSTNRTASLHGGVPPCDQDVKKPTP